MSSCGPRNRCSRFLAIVVVFLVSSDLFSQVRSGIRSPVVAILNSDLAQPGTITILAPPISIDDCDYYVEQLELSDEQRAFLHDAWLKYAAQWDELDGELMLVVRRAADRAQQLQTLEAYSAAAVDAWSRFDDAEGALLERQKELDASLFQVMLPVLTETQLNRFPRVIQHRDRVRAGGFPSVIPAAGIDLTEIARSVDALATNPTLDQLIQQYEAALTQSMIKRHAAIRPASRENNILFHDIKYDSDGNPRDFAAPEHAARHASMHAIATRS